MSTTNSEPKALLTPAETAALLGCSVRHVHNLKKRKCLIPIEGWGRPRYSREQIMQYVNSTVKTVQAA